MKKPSEVLKAARDLIATPDKWCQGYWAYNSQHYSRDPNDSDACVWCARGAIYKVLNSSILACEDPVDETEKILSIVMTHDIAEFNDRPGTRHSDVIAAYNAAIVLAEKQERESEEL